MTPKFPLLSTMASKQTLETSLPTAAVMPKVPACYCVIPFL